MKVFEGFAFEAFVYPSPLLVVKFAIVSNAKPIEKLQPTAPQEVAGWKMTEMLRLEPCCTSSRFPNP